MSAIIYPASLKAIAIAAQSIKAGSIVAMPTETVYGLAADATNSDAILNIYEVKNRPQFNPLIVHFSSLKAALPYVEVNKYAEILAESFCPGPLTMILRRTKNCTLSPLVSAGMDTVAIRIPDNIIAKALIEMSGKPLAAPSANASGKISPTKASHVYASLGDSARMILDGGECKVGLESTVLDLSEDIPAILRSGTITQEDIAEALNTEVLTAGCKAVKLANQIGTNVNGELTKTPPEKLKSPGNIASHYAPEIKLRKNVNKSKAGEAFLGFGDCCKDAVLNLSPAGDLREAAANLFSMLWQLDDKEKYSAIAVAPIPDKGLGIAINDRLTRAAADKNS